jgi:hypothetical protein
MRTMARLMVYLNNGDAMPGELEQHQDVETIRSMGAIPDPKWEVTDSNGHYHARDTSADSYPTLESSIRQVECDGSCDGTCDGEGWTETIYHCAICAEEIQPGTIGGPHTIHVPGLKSWEVTAYGARPLDEKVTVRIQTADTTLFGVAMPVSFESDSSGMTCTKLVGVSPLGARKP